MNRLFSSRVIAFFAGLAFAASAFLTSTSAQATLCSPVSVQEARARFDQAMIDANAHLQAAYNVAQVNMQARFTQADNRRSIAMSIPKLDPDHSADRMNEIQSQYLQDMQDAKNQYALEVSAARGRYDFESIRAQEDYKSALCM